jgi:presequence protease
MNRFELTASRKLTALQAQSHVYEHAATGALHLHLATDEPELAFAVGFTTLPGAHDGRAHILEHMVCSGSQRYPVRDLFFAMMRRSIATFINAMTHDDRTVYPFSTTDAVDFDNLLGVYLDTTFFPKLDRMTFLQEGWRPSLAGDGQLQIQGVVFNEMKAAYAEPVRAMYIALMQHLFGGTIYGTDSGGDPLCIPQLSYEALRDFHAAHYHPSQAVFMTAGNLDPLQVQARIEERVLSRFTGRRPRLLPPLAPPLPGVQQREIRMPVAEGTAENEHGVQLAWRVNEASTLADRVRADLVMEALAGHGGAPLRRAIQALGFGRATDFVGAEVSTRQVVLHVGMTGLTTEQVPLAEAALLKAVQDAARDGLPPAALQSVMRGQRFAQRWPRNGMQRLLAVADAGLRGGDMLQELDKAAMLDQLEQDVLAPDFVQRTLSELLAKATEFRVRVLPDEQYYAAREQAESRLIAERQTALDDAARAAIEADTAALAAHQAQPSLAAERLPQIHPADLSRHARPLLALGFDAQGDSATVLAGEGISFAQLRVDVSAMARDDIAWMALLDGLLPRLGAAGRGHAEASEWLQSKVQRFFSRLDIRSALDGRLLVNWCIEAHALREEQAGIAEVIGAWFATPQLDAHERIAQLLRDHLQQYQAGIAQQSVSCAQLAATAPFSVASALSELLEGLPSVAFQARLLKLLEQPGGVAEIAAHLQRVLRLVHAAPRHVHSAGREGDAPALLRAVRDCVAGVDGDAAATAALPAAGAAPQAQSASSAPPALAVLAEDIHINFCTMAWPVPRMDHEDAAALAVLAQLLPQQFLHARVREQGGAYGVAAEADGFNGTFVLVSNADPRVQGTYADYTASVAEVQTADISPDALNHAILGVIKALDMPLVPHALWHQSLDAVSRGSTASVRQAFRERVLDCTLAQLRAVATRYLGEAQARRAAAVGVSGAELGDLQPLDLLAHARALGLLKDAAAPGPVPA